ncbi:hypothetical protein DRQ50_12495 [bacterium]|nr:MAG: hypothetical protein DRQ50_12495 [bacterium]
MHFRCDRVQTFALIDQTLTEEAIMKFKRLVLPAALVILVVSFWSFQAGAYNLFTVEDGSCSQCHTDWPGTDHSFHSGAFDCSTCHDGSVGDNPVVTARCTACHSSEDLFNLHGGMLTPISDEYCGYCHPGVATERQSLTELRSVFD